MTAVNRDLDVGLPEDTRRLRKVILEAAARLGWPDIPSEVTYSIPQLCSEAAGSTPAVGEDAWRLVCQTARPEELFYVHAWLRSRMKVGCRAGRLRKLRLIDLIKVDMDVDAEMKRRGIRTQQMKDHDAQWSFLWRTLPRGRSGPGMTVDELLARWRKIHGSRPSRGLVDMLDSSFIIKTGKGKAGSPYRYHQR